MNSLGHAVVSFIVFLANHTNCLKMAFFMLNSQNRTSAEKPANEPHTRKKSQRTLVLKPVRNQKLKIYQKNIRPGKVVQVALQKKERKQVLTVNLKMNRGMLVSRLQREMLKESDKMTPAAVLVLGIGLYVTTIKNHHLK